MTIASQEGLHCSKPTTGHDKSDLVVHAQPEILATADTSGLDAECDPGSHRFQLTDIAQIGFSCLARGRAFAPGEGFAEEPDFLSRKCIAQDRLVHPGGPRRIERKPFAP